MLSSSCTNDNCCNKTEEQPQTNDTCCSDTENSCTSQNNTSQAGSSTESSNSGVFRRRTKKEREEAKAQARKNLPSIKSRRGVAVDKQTFIESTHKQFKMNLNEKIEKGETVLACFSGGVSSTAMICMLNHCVASNPNWKLHFKWEYLFIDIGGVLSMSTEERAVLTQQIREVCTTMNEHNQVIHILSIEDMLFDGDVDRMRNFIFKQFRTMSVHEDLLNQMVKTCIYKFASEKGFKNVLTAESANNMAVGVLSEVSKGRGYTVPLMVQLVDKTLNGIPSYFPSKDNNITFIRPMRTFLANELGVYNYWMKVNKFSFVKDVTTKVGVRQSTIHRLVEDFIYTLQKDYPSTVHAILRTIEKLKLPDQTTIRCSMCGTFLSKEDLREAKIGDDMSLSSCCCFGCKRVLSYCNTENKESITKVAVTDLTSEVFIDDSFPDYIQQSYKMTREDMKEHISEFLLEDNE